MKSDIKLLGENLKKLLFLRNLTQQDLQEAIGRSQSVISEYITGKKVPRLDTALKIASFFNVSLDALIRSEEDSTPDYGLSIGGYGVSEQERPDIRLNPEDFIFIPKLNHQCDKKNLITIDFNNFDAYIGLSKQYLKGLTKDISSLVSLDILSDLMAPTIERGDICLIDTNNKVLIDGNIYAVCIHNIIDIKRLIYQGDKKILIINDNKAIFKPLTIQYNEIDIIGQVIWHCRGLTLSIHFKEGK